MSIGRSLSHRAELGFIAGTVSGPEIEAEPLLEYEVVIVGQPAVVPVRPSRNQRTFAGAYGNGRDARRFRTFPLSLPNGGFGPLRDIRPRGKLQ
jgi:hypothetical protein